MLLGLPLLLGLAAPAASDMPQIVLSPDNFKLEEPQHASCSDSKIGNEKTFVDADNGHLAGVTHNYGPVLTTETYTVKLDRSPGAGKVVSVEIWEPTDLEAWPSMTSSGGRFRKNAQIHGIGWPPIREGRISIENSYHTNRGVPNLSKPYPNTYLTFTDNNWDRAKTVTVNIHCAQHNFTTPLPIWHFAFRHNTPTFGRSPHMYNRKGDNGPTNTSLRIAEVRVADRTEPAKITGNAPGNLVLDPDVSGYFVLSDDGEDGHAHIIGLDFRWNNPDNSHHNDYADANEKFAGFRVRLRTVEPAGHPVQEKFVRADFIIPGDTPTFASWHLGLEAKGYDHAKRFAPNLPDRKYEWSVVPVDRRWNNVETERVTRCVLMTGNTLDLTANPNCPAARQGEGASVPAVSVPDTAVANLQVAEVDTASVGVTWDAVEHATSYDVSWDANGSQTAVSGVESVTRTTATIRHDAQEAMTLTVTVTPEHLDGNGVVQQLDALAATATLAVGPGGDAQPAEIETPSCVSDALLAEVRTAAGETWRTSPGHVERWSRVLAAFGESNA